MKTSLGELRKEKISNEELRQEIENSLSFDLKLYDETETDKYLSFTLKDEVLETGLITFLEAIYPIVYKNRDDGEYQGLLKKIRETPSMDWIDLALKKSYRAFRFDKYAESQYIEFSKPFRPGVSIDFNCIMLYLGYGKIITEGIDDFTDFFKHCIHETFKEHPIVKSIRVYITG
jgi:hypothetical protein